uniref:Uncharacterized protein n=1 Tax=Trypanosoma congolense (strain IL3000) TaxID=1068625 RepID=G0UUL5_TRYCI|nr:hypothetical protein, unlikely [Trypanosoma congolense IL3000]
MMNMILRCAVDKKAVYIFINRGDVIVADGGHWKEIVLHFFFPSLDVGKISIRLTFALPERVFPFISSKHFKVWYAELQVFFSVLMKLCKESRKLFLLSFPPSTLPRIVMLSAGTELTRHKGGRDTECATQVD